MAKIALKYTLWSKWGHIFLSLKNKLLIIIHIVGSKALQSLCWIVMHNLPTLNKVKR